MSTFAVASTRSSPGATSLAVGLSFVWQKQGREPLLVEADPAGGVLGLRFNLAAEPSLATLSADLRRGYESDRFLRNAVDVNGVRTLLAPIDPLTSSRVLDRNGSIFGKIFSVYRRPTVIDIGRIGHASPALALARAADRVLLVGRPVVDDIQSLLFGIRLLRSNGCQVSLVLVGDKPYHPMEVAELAGVRLAAVIPEDAALAVAFRGARYSARALRRSLLWRSIGGLADALLGSYPYSDVTAELPSELTTEPSLEPYVDAPTSPGPATGAVRAPVYRAGDPR